MINILVITALAANIGLNIVDRSRAITMLVCNFLTICYFGISSTFNPETMGSQYSLTNKEDVTSAMITTFGLATCTFFINNQVDICISPKKIRNNEERDDMSPELKHKNNYVQ